MSLSCLLESTSGPNCPSPNVVLDKTCYFVTTETGTMDASKTTCMVNGGHLATLDTIEKSNQVKTFLDTIEGEYLDLHRTG